MAGEDEILPIPNLKVAQYTFTLSNPKLVHLHDEAATNLLVAIEADDMAPYLKLLLSQSPSIIPQRLTSNARDLVEKLSGRNKAELEALEQKLKDAEETEGETEISDALRAKASYLTKIGEKDAAAAAQTLASSKTPGVGARIDITLTLVRIGFFFNDYKLIEPNIAAAEKLIEKGGDWDRLNRLKVYRALKFISLRDFKKAGELLVDSLSTFTATELIDYNDFVGLAIIVNTLVQKRVDLKKKIISSPEVTQVVLDVPLLGDFLMSLYNCHYAKFFAALASVEQELLLTSRLLSPHARYYVREVRILAYSQILESYRSLTLQSLSLSFGVSIDFIDRDLSHFISSGRLNCTIDRVHGIVETNRPSAKNAQYDTLVRQGDVLLNSIQRLSRVLY
ncbi:PCI-domain-containing protein [Cantharellus anzutake]|uniref:PCI-domain-containing protein n=1 Tax=Cantharellus anzutake TaxID=1750568 RepID=UPI0019043420|nr:PCI-domain-containing protein [Cantharellus anzutake]KAF8338167.1 PCI-domain-containing protein [Cantharellus anzutake]